MFLPLVSVFADVATEAAPIPDPGSDATRVTVSADATVTPESIGLNAGRGNARGISGAGNATLTIYPWKALLDDASPRSLQPFLQRTSAVSIEAGGAYSTLKYSRLGGGTTLTTASVPASASVRWFVLPSLALFGEAGGLYSRGESKGGIFPVTSKLWEAWGTVGADVRAGDASLSLQWQALVIDQKVTFLGDVSPEFFAPRFTLSGRIVLDRHYDLMAGASLIPDGTVGRAGFGWYPTKDLGLSARVQYARVSLNALKSHSDSILFGPTLSYWVGRRVELLVSYEPVWSTSPGTTEWQHRVMAGIAGRLPAAVQIQPTNPPPIEQPNPPLIPEPTPAPGQETAPIQETKPSE
jgi:hypothetical protein